MSLVVSDAGPLHYLLLIGEAGVLPRMFQRVVVPHRILQVEFNHPATPTAVRSWAQAPPSWIEARQPAHPWPGPLGVGECEAIGLALELNCPILLDDLAARRAAASEGLQMVGTLGILERAGEKGWINLTQALERLRRTNIRLSPHLIEAVLDRHTRKSGQA